jgi:hypothetical protein
VAARDVPVAACDGERRPAMARGGLRWRAAACDGVRTSSRPGVTRGS